MVLTEKQAIQRTIEKLIAKNDLKREEIFRVLEEIKIGNATNAQIGGFLVGLVVKGVNVDELSAIAEWMRQNAIAVKPKVKGQIIDTCGTGGGVLTFNVSTANAIMAAAAGIPVAKHGSRSISHKSGSADVLEALGVNINLTKEQAESLIEKVGFAFLYAPRFHPVMGKVLGPENELGIKTVFYTVVGPLINPARVEAHVLGIYKKELVELVAQVLAKLGYVRALVVHGLDGLDEISNTGPTLVAEVQDGRVSDVYHITPEELGVQRARIEDLQPEADDPEYNAEIIKRLFKGETLRGKRDFLALNAAGALYVGGATKNLKDGVELSMNILDEGLAYRKLEEIVKTSHGV